MKTLNYSEQAQVYIIYTIWCFFGLSPFYFIKLFRSTVGNFQFVALSEQKLYSYFPFCLQGRRFYVCPLPDRFLFGVIIILMFATFLGPREDLQMKL